MGSLAIINPIGPQILYHHQTLIKNGDVSRQRFWGTTTYGEQLQAFVDAIQKNATFPTDPIDACHNMALIDAIYTKSGRSIRQGIT